MRVLHEASCVAQSLDGESDGESACPRIIRVYATSCAVFKTGDTLGDSNSAGPAQTKCGGVTPSVAGESSKRGVEDDCEEKAPAIKPGAGMAGCWRRNAGVEKSKRSRDTQSRRSRRHHHRLWPPLPASQADQHLNRAGRPETRHQGSRRGHLARQLRALRSRLLRPGAENLATPRQPVRHEVVTHVLGTTCYLCLRAGHTG